MQLNLQNHVAIVIGGASGIGLAIAKEFAREGCRVAIIDKSERTESQALSISEEPTQARSASEGPGSAAAIGLVADVTDYAAMQAAAKRAQEALGPVQHVVYAAGMGSGKFGFPF